MANYFTDRVVQYPGRVTMTPTGNENEYDFARSEGNVTSEGTPFSAAKFNEIANTIHAYGTCTSAAGTATKTVTCPGFVLNSGATITVLFSNANSVSGTTSLNVNGTGAREIRRVTGSAMSRPPVWNANGVVTFVYTGSYWLIAGQDTSEFAIIEAGTSNGWNYQKFANGFFTATKAMTTNVAITTQSGGIYYSPGIAVGMPTAFTVASVTGAFCSYSGPEGVWGKTNTVNTSEFSAGLVSSVQRSAQTRTIYCSLTGTWT